VHGSRSSEGFARPILLDLFTSCSSERRIKLTCCLQLDAGNVKLMQCHPEWSISLHQQYQLDERIIVLDLLHHRRTSGDAIIQQLYQQQQEAVQRGDAIIPACDGRNRAYRPFLRRSDYFPTVSSRFFAA
jgi:hypothetical protein